MPTKAILFDLDGTLLDTAPDLGYALNVLLTQHKQPIQPLAKIRTVASHGSQGLLKLGFGVTDTDPTYAGLREQFLTIYAQHLARDTQLFAGIENVLQYLEKHNIAWGVVTNKPAALTNPLMRKMHLDQRAQCIVSGDTLSVSKPNPEPLWHACDLIGVQPQDSIFIGDAQWDIEAGRRSGMRTLIAAYGYIAAEDEPATWQADGMLQQPDELLQWL